MIQLLTKKRFRFKNPNADMIKQVVVGVGADKKQIQTMDGAKFEDTYFEVAPDILTACPDWVRTDKIFEWGTAEGSIIEVKTKSEAQAEAQRQQKEAQRGAEQSEKSEKEGQEQDALSKMTKIELLKYASDNHELELSTAMTKDKILDAIAEAKKESSEPEGA